MRILDGKKISQDIKNELKNLVSNRLAKGLKKPHLAAIIVGNDGASLTYVGSKVKACDYVGYDSSLIQLEESITDEFLLEQINKLNSNNSCTINSSWCKCVRRVNLSYYSLTCLCL